MGKISEYILELSETFNDLLWHTGNQKQAMDNMKEMLTDDEYKFFVQHLDIVEMNIKDMNNIEEENDDIEMSESLVDGDSSKERFIDLKGPTGNAFSILASANSLCKQLEEANPEEYNWKNIEKEMTSGDYKNLVNTFEKYFGDYVTIYNADVLNEKNKVVEGYEEHEPYNSENLIGKIVNKINGNHDLILWFDDGSKANIGCAGGAGVGVDGNIENIYNNEIIDVKQEDNYIIVLFFDNNEELYIEDPTGGEGLEIDYINDSLKMPSIDAF